MEKTRKATFMALVASFQPVPRKIKILAGPEVFIGLEAADLEAICVHRGT